MFLRKHIEMMSEFQVPGSFRGVEIFYYGLYYVYILKTLVHLKAEFAVNKLCAHPNGIF